MDLLRTYAEIKLDRLISSEPLGHVPPMGYPYSCGLDQGQALCSPNCGLGYGFAGWVSQCGCLRPIRKAGVDLYGLKVVKRVIVLVQALKDLASDYFG